MDGTSASTGATMQLAAPRGTDTAPDLELFRASVSAVGWGAGRLARECRMKTRSAERLLAGDRPVPAGVWHAVKVALAEVPPELLPDPDLPRKLAAIGCHVP